MLLLIQSTKKDFNSVIYNNNNNNTPFQSISFWMNDKTWLFLDFYKKPSYLQVQFVRICNY